MRILITGAGGYLGSVLTPYLLKAGHAVTALDLFLHGENSLAVCCGYERFEVVRGDARHLSTLKSLAEKADLVIPLAAIVGATACERDQIAARTTNQTAISTLCELLQPSQKIILPTTNSGYGVGEQGKECDEDSPLRPISLYGVTKMEAERRVLDRANSISFRLATVFGAAPRMRMDLLVNDFVYRAMTDKVICVFEGHFKRNYIHIKDVARAFLHAIEHFDTLKGKCYNVGMSDANLSKIELCQVIGKHLPFACLEAATGKDEDQRNYIVSNKRIEATGWRPIQTLDDGIAELIKLYKTLSPRRYANA